MTVADLVIHLREALRRASAAGEPDSWPISIEKNELRALLDAIELDSEHRHLIEAASALG